MSHLPRTTLEKWKDPGAAKNRRLSGALAGYSGFLDRAQKPESEKVSVWLGVGSSGTRTWCEVVSELLVGGSNRDELERSAWGSWLQSALRGEQTTGKAGFCGPVVVVISQKLGGRVRWFSGHIWSQKCIMGDRDYPIGTTLSNSQTWTFAFHVTL